MQNDKFRRKYNIVCATDDNYVPICGIMLTSLFKSNPGCYFSVYVLTKGLNKESKSLLYNSLGKLGGVSGEINICEVDDSVIKKIPVRISFHFTIATFYRFLIADILHEDVDRVLYLDCDILVRGDISKLYDIDMTDIAVAACLQPNGENGKFISGPIEGVIEPFGYPKRYGYFNVGVLMINLEYWREHNVADQLIAYLADNYNKCTFLDQDVLNAVLYNRKKNIPLKYNVMTQFLKGHNDTENPYIQENPVIVHYSGMHKPWDWNVADYPFKKEWEHCRDISLWSDWKAKFTFKESFKIFMIKCACRIFGKKRFYFDPVWKKWETTH